MATNVEIKASVKDWEGLRTRVATLSDTEGELIIQEDTFFHAPRGRLKLRVLSPEQGMLVYYERANVAGPKASHYTISTTTEPDTLKSALSQALGVRGIVNKQRWLYVIGSTRVHLDQVETLGNFLELEVVLGRGQSVTEGELIAVDLMTQLGIAPQDLVVGAYIDLMETNTL